MQNEMSGPETLHVRTLTGINLTEGRERTKKGFGVDYCLNSISSFRNPSGSLNEAKHRMTIWSTDAPYVVGVIGRRARLQLRTTMRELSQLTDPIPRQEVLNFATLSIMDRSYLITPPTSAVNNTSWICVLVGKASEGRN